MESRVAHSLCIFVVLRKTCRSLFFSLSIRVLKIQHFVEGMMAGTLIHSSNSHSTYRFLNKLCASSQSFCVLVRTKTMPQSEQSTTHLHVLHFKNCFSLLFPDVPGTSEMVHSRITFSRVCPFMRLRSYHCSLQQQQQQQNFYYQNTITLFLKNIKHQYRDTCMVDM